MKGEKILADSSVITVAQLNRYVKSLLDGDLNLQTVFVSGEISGLILNRSGHYYFNLKDECAVVKTVMFRNSASRLKFVPENDMKVICRCKVTLYEPHGSYQLVADDIQPDGAGALSIAFEQLKARLESEGLFSQDHKKSIPEFPCRVGVITSPTGAAVKDIINVLSRRFPFAEMVFYPVSVQGVGSAEAIAEAIAYMNHNNSADVIIVGRGGGSIEDLWEFNKETVAYAVYNSDIPVISAVGHETDFTICDFVADLRAPTPSAAAELAVPDIMSLKKLLSNYNNDISHLVETRIFDMRNSLSMLGFSLDKLSPASYISEMKKRCLNCDEKMTSAIKLILTTKRSNFSSLCSKLDALSPLKILSRGFVSVSKNGSVINSVNDVCSGDNIDLRLCDGTIECIVK